VQGVKWTVLGYNRISSRRLIPSDKYNEIQRLHDTRNENRLRAVVECWLGGSGKVSGQKPSWRSLIWTLDAGGQTRVADKIRHFAEPVLGKSCDSISVSTLLYSVYISSHKTALMQSVPHISICTTTHALCIPIVIAVEPSLADQLGTNICPL